MKIKQHLTTGLLAIASLALIVPAADAAWTPTQGDLIVAFSGPNDNPGSIRTGRTLMVDLGSITQFTIGAFSTGTHIINSANATATLADIGTAGSSDWGTTTGVFSLFGTTTSNQNVWLSAPHGDPAYQNGGVTPTNAASSEIFTVTFNPGTGTGLVASTTPNSVIQRNSNANVPQAWARYNFGDLSQTLAWDTYNNTEAPLSGGSLDLYAIVNAGTTDATLLGTMSFNTGNGQLTYTSAVPEPGTYALLLVGIGSFYLLRRRRTQAAV